MRYIEGILRSFENLRVAEGGSSQVGCKDSDITPPLKKPCQKAIAIWVRGLTPGTGDVPTITMVMTS